MYRPLKKTLGLEKNLPLGDTLIIAFAYSYLLVVLAVILLGSLYQIVFGIPETAGSNAETGKKSVRKSNITAPPNPDISPV